MQEKEEKVNDIDKVLKAKQKELEELNLQLLQRREDIQKTHKSLEQPDRTSKVQETEDASQYSVQSEALGSDAEDDTLEQPSQEDTLSLPLSQHLVKKKLKELVSQTITSTTRDTDSYSRRRKALELDFIRFGRKTRNDKDVQLFLRVLKGYKRQHPEHSDNHLQLNIPELKSILNVTQQIKIMSQDLQKYLEAYNKDLAEEFDKLKSQKSQKTKYLPFQMLQDNFYKACKIKLEDLLNYSQD